MCMACGSRCDYNEAVTEVRTETMASRRARFEKLAMPVVDALYRQAMKLTNDPDDAQDLVQDTFERGSRRSTPFRRERISPHG